MPGSPWDAYDRMEVSINHPSSKDAGKPAYQQLLYADGHVEGRMNEEIDLERGVGQKGGLLWRLRN